MELKKISIPKTSTYFVEGEGFKTREEILLLSKSWSESHMTLFKKLARQGGVCSIGGTKFTIQPLDKVVNSKGVKESADVIPPKE